MAPEPDLERSQVWGIIASGGEPDLVQVVLSAYLGAVGQPVAAQAVSILDDATMVSRGDSSLIS